MSLERADPTVAGSDEPICYLRKNGRVLPLLRCFLHMCEICSGGYFEIMHAFQLEKSATLSLIAIIHELLSTLDHFFYNAFQNLGLEYGEEWLGMQSPGPSPDCRVIPVQRR